MIGLGVLTSLCAIVLPLNGLVVGLFPVRLRATLVGATLNSAVLIFGASAPLIQNSLADAMATYPSPPIDLEAAVAAGRYETLEVHCDFGAPGSDDAEGTGDSAGTREAREVMKPLRMSSS